MIIRLAWTTRSNWQSCGRDSAESKIVFRVPPKSFLRGSSQKEFHFSLFFRKLIIADFSGLRYFDESMSLCRGQPGGSVFLTNFIQLPIYFRHELNPPHSIQWVVLLDQVAEFPLPNSSNWIPVHRRPLSNQSGYQTHWMEKAAFKNSRHEI